MSYVVLYFLAFLPAATSYYYDGRVPDPRIRHEVNVYYRTISDCLIALEAKDRVYRRASSWLIHAECSTDNPNDHR